MSEIIKKGNDSRTKNSVRNIASAIVLSIFVTVIPFAIRTIMAYTIGFEYLGLNNLFMSIVQILNMSELGIGSVMVYFLYAPAAVDNREKIDAYMNILRKIYAIIGLFILLAGIVITPFVNRFITGDIPANTNLKLLFLMYVVGTVIPYFLFPEEVTLVEAFQRKDITNRISFIANGISYVIQILGLIVYKSYTLYLAAVIVQSVITGILRKYYGMKFYSGYHPQGNISHEEKKDISLRVASMIGHQMDEKLLYSIDTVFISSIMGLSTVALYGNYYYVTTAIAMLFDMVYMAVLPSVGNAVAVEKNSDNYRRFMQLFWIGACFTGWATLCMLCLYQNFMELWMGSDNMFEMDVVVLFCLYFYLSQIRRTVVTFKNAAGMWWNDRYKPYISMAIDLLLDLVLIKVIGVKGAIISSIICVGVIEIPWETKVLFRDYFHKGAKQYIIEMLTYSVVNFGIMMLAYVLCNLLVSGNGVLSLLIRILICCGSIVIYAAVYWRSSELGLWRRKLKGLRNRHIDARN